MMRLLIQIKAVQVSNSRHGQNNKRAIPRGNAIYVKTTDRKSQLNSSMRAARTHMIKGRVVPGFIALALRLYKLVIDPYP